ncbi:MAG: hypothetical protein RIB64_21840 [Arenibacter algicola]|tara:strand:+ start:17 stop:307 length:291 start_codon:yes stop_codon:yes gene_type:complete
MNEKTQEHINKLVGYKERHEIIRKAYNTRSKSSKSMKVEMEGIRYTCFKYIQHNNLIQGLTFGGTTPQHQAEFNDFDNISDFHILIDEVIEKLKFK